MTPNDETLANVAKWLGWKRYDLLARPFGADRDEYHSRRCCYPCIYERRKGEWVIQSGPTCDGGLIRPLGRFMLSPDGEHAVRARLMEMGYKVTQYAHSPAIYAANVERDGHLCDLQKAYSPAVALLLAVAQLAEGGR
jgi:hypothetical protein